MNRLMQLLVATTALATIAGAAGASNFIDIDASTNGSVKTLAITQDSLSANNSVSGSLNGGGNPTGSFVVNGAWQNIAITQTSGSGAGNKLTGSIKAGAGTNSFAPTYVTDTSAAGNNVHSLVLDAGGAAATTIAVSNTGDSDNTVTDQLKASGNVTYNLALHGTGNTVTNTIGQPGSGDSPIDPATTIALGLNVTGDNNTITNTSTNNGLKTINVTLASSGNTVENQFNSVAGAQSSNLLGDAATKVDYLLNSSAADTTADVTLNGVIGSSNNAAVVRVSQSGSGASALLAVNGNGFTMGNTLTGPSSESAGMVVTQASPGAYLHGTVTAAASNYTVSISQ